MNSRLSAGNRTAGTNNFYFYFYRLMRFALIDVSLRIVIVNIFPLLLSPFSRRSHRKVVERQYKTRQNPSFPLLILFEKTILHYQWDMSHLICVPRTNSFTLFALNIDRKISPRILCLQKEIIGWSHAIEIER